MRNNSKIISILTIICFVMIVFSGCMYKERVIDLGDGWQSYHHERIGMTVKIPLDAEFHVSKDWETNVVGTSFSKGPIESVNTWQLYYADTSKTYENRVDEYREELLEEDEKWMRHMVGREKKTIRQRSLFEEIKIKEKIVFVEFIEVEGEEVNNFSIKMLHVPIDENRFGYVRFGFTADRLHEIYPHLLEGDIETRTNAYIEIIKKLIVSIDD